MPACPALRPRWIPQARPLRLSDAAFRYVDGVGFHNSLISGLYHAACMLPVYASQPGSPPHYARLGSGCWPALPGEIGCSLGPYTRFQLCHIILLAQALLGAPTLQSLLLKTKDRAIRPCLLNENISVPFGDGGNPSPLGEEKFIYCRYATLSTWSTYKE